MKKQTVVFAMMMVLVALYAASASAQTVVQQPQIDPRAMYEQNNYQLAQPFDLGKMPTATATKKGVRSASAAFPGDGAQFAILKLNREFYENGDRLVARLVGLKDQGAFTITGRITYYNEFTKQTEAKYFTPEVCGYRGYCPSGLAAHQNLVVYSEEIATSSMAGGYAMDVTLWSVDSPLLRQQVFSYYYIGRTPAVGRMLMFVDKVAVDGNYLKIDGQFWADDVIVWSGNITEGFTSINPSAKVAESRFINIQQPFGFGEGEHPVDIVVFSPSMRICATFPRAYIGKAASAVLNTGTGQAIQQQ